MPFVLRVCPFSIAVFFGTTVYVTYQLRRQQKRTTSRSSDESNTTTCSTQPQRQRTVKVVFVLGAPGVGKGTQCQLISERLGQSNDGTATARWVHLSAGDLLRAERNKSNSVLADEINACIAAGQLVASEITCQLLRNAMTETLQQQQQSTDNHHHDYDECHFLIDGFPRSQSNADAWHATAKSGATTGYEYRVVAILDYVCPEETLIGRILERGKSSGRTDDNLTAIRARFQTFAQETKPLLDYYKHEQSHIPVYTIATDKPVEAVYQETIQYFQQL